jgi:transcriptional regulator with XRE-family HTH domain
MSSWNEAGTLKKIREALGVSQVDLSRKSGVSRASIANFESDRYKLSTADLAAIYDALAAVEVSRGIQQPNNEAAKLLVGVLYFNIIWGRENIADAERELLRAKQKLALTKGWQAEKEEAFKSAAKLVTLEDLATAKEYSGPLYPRHRTNVREKRRLLGRKEKQNR